MRAKYRAVIAALASGNVSPAHATILHWTLSLGPEAAGATGSGSATASFDDATSLSCYDLVFSGLSGATTVAQFHRCVASPGTVAGARAAFLNGPNGGTAAPDACVRVL